MKSDAYKNSKIVRVELWMWEGLRRLALLEHRSVSGQLAHVLEAYLGDHAIIRPVVKESKK